MSQERAFVENLLNQRVNMFLVLFSVTMGATIQLRGTGTLQAIVLTIGTFLLSIMLLSIIRAQQKLDVILGVLFQDDTHPAKIADNLAIPKISARKVVGYGLPITCVTILIVTSGLAWTGYIDAILKTSVPSPAIHCQPNEQTAQQK
ncbi:hypothetical protein [Azospirillum sp. TSH100]|uniref:hypothetical protein n=1 Tax=Azospirillum sp. TSH100 TaxID=652764 RepID=UPI0010AA04B3|nr:hypothetical protein [Azospirillum sp. TSH100]QCG87452.1 hypothetical protein E6C72_06770 [Azospirillum sp. TSH100]